MRHLLQQRQVIHRIAVEVAVFQAVPGFFEPAIQTRDLAFAEARHIGAAPGVAAIFHLALGGDQGFNPQARGNRCGDEAVGRGDDHQLVAGGTVLGQQFHGLR